MIDLLLSHWKDEMAVRVDSNLVQKMKSHHFLGVRFLYNMYKRKRRGAILNYDDGMNFPWILQIFLGAVFKYHKVDSPVLILTTKSNMHTWHYHMKEIGVNVMLLGDKSKCYCNEIFKNGSGSIILASHGDLSIIRSYQDNKFEFVIVDQFDVVANRVIFKRLAGSFNIALTNKDFTLDRDQKLLWQMLNWTNPRSFGKLVEFYKNDDYHLRKLTDPYDEVWHRLSWNNCDGFSRETDEELEAYKKAVDDWVVTNKIAKSDNTSYKLRTGKRKLQNSQKNGKEKNKKGQECLSLTSSESVEETQKQFGDISSKKSFTSLDKKFPELPRVNKKVTKSTRKVNIRKNKFNVETYKKNSEQTFIEASANNNIATFDTEILELSQGCRTKDIEILEPESYEKLNELSQDCCNKFEPESHEKPNELPQDCCNKDKETLDSEKPKKLSQDCYTDEKEVVNQLSSDNHNEDVQVLKQTISDDNTKPFTEGNTEIDENSLLTAVIKGSPLKGIAVQCTDTSSDEDEPDILLSIMEGKFSASQTGLINTLETHHHIDSLDSKSDTKKISKCNSESVLKSLFGDEAEYVEDFESSKQKRQMLTPLKCANEDYSSTGLSDKNRNKVFDWRKSKTDSQILESLFSFDEDALDYKTAKHECNLNDEQRNALISSLFGD